MEKEFIPYELALRMKQLGFSSPYPIGGYQGGKIFYYEDGELYYDHRPMYSSDAHSGQLLAPLFQQAFRWFREKHRLKHIWIMDELLDTGEYTYEEAELVCLKYCIEIVQSKSE